MERRISNKLIAMTLDALLGAAQTAPSLAQSVSGLLQDYSQVGGDNPMTLKTARLQLDLWLAVFREEVALWLKPSGQPKQPKQP